MKVLCEELLKEWCEALLKLQIRESGDLSRDGAIQCPACGKIHGRCFEAMYPFLHMAHKSGNQEWRQSAERLFCWAEHNVSQEDGSFINDLDCDWKGTTVFNTIQLTDCLLHHGDILSEDIRERWLLRLSRAAEFLYLCDEINNNNINYPISNALALYQCGMVLHNPKYMGKAQQLAMIAEEVLTEHRLIWGEGEPRFAKSARGCYAVDIGYNVEETLPSLALYARLSGNATAAKLSEESMMAHLDFMLDNGAWDNSFGTRNFKWTYWGSRTSDGCALGYLLYADRHPEFALAAQKNIELMKECTVDGLLAGGPHYRSAGQLPCVHHTFTHAKVLAGILDRGLCRKMLPGIKLPRQKKAGIDYYAEIDSWLCGFEDMTATITAYDWEYLPGGHVSGGTLSLLHHRLAGTLLCAGMSQYTLKEPHNMQQPVGVIHESLALRIEKQIGSVIYSSVYDTGAKVEVKDNIIRVDGHLKDITNQMAPDRNLAYTIIYEWSEFGLIIKAEFKEGNLICPLISRGDEAVEIQKGRYSVCIHKAEAEVVLETSEAFILPYDTERIFNLVPGLQALRVDLHAKKSTIELCISVKPR